MVGNSGAIWTGAGGLTLYRSRHPFRTAYLRFTLIEHRFSLHSDRYSHAARINQCFVLLSVHSMCNDAQSRLAYSGYWALWRRFSSRISLYLAAFIFPSIATSRPVPAAEKHPHSMMLPPPCFTVGTVLDRWWAVPGFLHTYCLELRPKSSILVSSDQRNLFVTILESFRCFLANSMRAFMCLAQRRGFRQATLP